MADEPSGQEHARFAPRLRALGIDPAAAREVVADLDEDAGSDHTPQAGSPRAG